MPSLSSLGNILIVDDDHTLTELLRLNLSSEGYNVDVVERTADLTADSFIDIHLVIVDASGQTPSGIDFITRFREWRGGDGIGVIYCSQFDCERVLIDALDAGADDSLCKPFSLRELMARIRAVLRRRKRTSAPASTINVVNIDNMHVDFSRKAVTIDEEFVNLSNTEYSILELLLRNSGTYTSRIEIFRSVWPDGTGANERIVDTNISRLRRKLGERGSIITNRPGLGYIIKR